MACWNEDKWRTINGVPVNLGKDCSKEISIIAAILIVAAVSGGVVGAAAIAVEVSGLGGSVPAAESPEASPAARAAAREIEGETASARNRAVQGRYADTWKRFGLRQVKPAIRHNFECAIASTGQIRASFLHRPCRSMTRRLELLIDDQGRLVVVSIAWVRMYGIESAIQLQDLAESDAPDTGWVLPLNGELVGHPEIRFGVEHRVVSRRNSIVMFSDSVPVAGIADPMVLDGLSDVASDFPNPDP